jgi:hypothetical protein
VWRASLGIVKRWCVLQLSQQAHVFRRHPILTRIHNQKKSDKRQNIMYAINCTANQSIECKQWLNGPPFLACGGPH